MKKQLFLVFSSLIFSFVAFGQEKNFTDGVFILNEDWFGHNNSTINFWHVYGDNSIDYRIIQQANPGYSLGCTAQSGTIYGDKLFVVSKQAQDDGESAVVQGARFIVADAQTMTCLARIEKIAENDKGQSIADGRAFVGVDENTGYIGTSNGIYVFDFHTMEIQNRIEGSENPLVTGSENNADGLGPLYRNQIGIMIRTQDYVFAIQQDKGILVINPATHTIIDVIEGCFSTMVLARDGNIYAGKNSNMENDGKYQEYPYGERGASGEKWQGNQLLKLNPVTLETTIIQLEEAGINQSWYAWTAGSLVASAHTNSLYFIHINVETSAEWFTACKVYKYDIDNNTVTEMLNTEETYERYIYTGAGLSISPLNDELFVNMYLDVINQNYWFSRFNNNMNFLNEKQPSQNYWFPAMIIYPDNYAPEVGELSDIVISNTTDSLNINLANIASDRDNMDAGIVKSIKSISNPALLQAYIKGNTLTIKPVEGNSGTSVVNLQFNSNGKLAERQFAVTTSTTTVWEQVSRVLITVNNGIVGISGIERTAKVEVFNISGMLLYSQQADSDKLEILLAPQQIYILKINNKAYKIKL